MSYISKLEGIKRQAQKEDWAKFICTAADEEALLNGFTFSYDHYDVFRFFCENMVVLTKGKWEGQPFEFLPFQEIICGSLFGWIEEDTALRRFRRAYIQMAKKNTKTTLASAIGLFMFCGDGEGSPEVYNAANDKDQAALLWDIAAEVVEMSPRLKSMIDIVRSKRRMLIGTKSCFNAWSSDQSSKDGPNIHLCIVDELHEWKAAGREFWGKIRYGGIAREQPICPLVITTPGDDKHSLCYEQYDYAKRILDGSVKTDFRLYAFIAEPDLERINKDPNYWKTEECHRAGNPAYGYVLKKEDFEADIIEVENDPVAKARFFRYRLGVWVDSASPWIPAHIWQENAGPGFTEKDLEGRLCFTGLDLSSVDDLTAIAHVFPFPVGDAIHYKMLARIFCPEETLTQRVRKSDSPFGAWVQQGFITPTPGSAIDHNFIWESLKADFKKFNIHEIGYDRNSAAWIVQQCEKEFPNTEMFPMAGTFAQLTGPISDLETALKQNRCEHNNNPVLDWMRANVMVEENFAKEKRFSKKKAKGKIDGIMALTFAYCQARLGELNPKKRASIYSNENFARKIKELEGIEVQ